MLPLAIGRDRPMTRDPYDAMEPEMRRRSTIAVTAILAAILLGAVGLLLWSFVIGAPSGASTIGVGK